MNNKIKCTEEECVGHVNFDMPLAVRTGCQSFNTAYPCSTCGRVYWYNEEKKEVTGVLSRREEKLYVKNGELELVPKNKTA